jgi:hypothetical protein
LLIAKSFDTERAATQRLGRVGRNKDLCKRYLLQGTELVNQATANQLFGELMKAMKLI